MLTPNVVWTCAFCWEYIRLKRIRILKRNVEGERDVVPELHKWKSFSTSLRQLGVDRVILNV